MDNPQPSGKQQTMEAIKTIEVKEENLPKRNKNNDKPIKRSMKEKKKIEK